MGCGHSKKRPDVTDPGKKKKRSRKTKSSKKLNPDSVDQAQKGFMSLGYFEKDSLIPGEKLKGSEATASINPSKLSPQNSAGSSINAIYTTNEFKQPKTYNMVVLDYCQKTNSIFQDKPIIETKISINGGNIPLTFSTHLISKPDSSIPTVVDCILYVVSSQDCFDVVRQAHKAFKFVWSQTLMPAGDFGSGDLIGLSDEIGLKLINHVSDFYLNVFEDDRKLHELLEEVFVKLDKNQDGFIDIKELKKAEKHMGGSSSEEDLRTAMEEMDLDEDGKIDFSEFVFWWKRGRQGAVSIQKLVLNSAHKFVQKLPGAKDILRKIAGNSSRLIPKKVQNKTINLQIGPQFKNPEMNLKLCLGKSARREQFTAEAVNALNYNIKECWFAAVFKSKKTEVDPLHIEKFSQTGKAMLNSVLASAYDGEAISESLGADFKSSGNKLFAGFWIDVTDEAVQEVFEGFESFESIFKSPSDDFIDLEVGFKNGVTDLTEALTVSATISHWNNLSDVLMESFQVNGLSEILRFLPLFCSGKANLKFKSGLPKSLSEPLSNWCRGVLKWLVSLTAYFPQNPQCFIQTISENYERSFELYGRYNNIGFKMTLELPRLLELTSMVN